MAKVLDPKEAKAWKEILIAQVGFIMETVLPNAFAEGDPDRQVIFKILDVVKDDVQNLVEIADLSPIEKHTRNRSRAQGNK